LINVSKFYCLFQAFLQSFISLFNLFYGHFPIQFTHFRHFGKLKSLFKQYGLGFLKRKRFLAFTLSKALKAVESGLVILLMYPLINKKSETMRRGGKKERSTFSPLFKHGDLSVLETIQLKPSLVI
jgi:hypothetical protein